jgi:hypothetical protein
MLSALSVDGKSCSHGSACRFYDICFGMKFSDICADYRARSVKFISRYGDDRAKKIAKWVGVPLVTVRQRFDDGRRSKILSAPVQAYEDLYGCDFSAFDFKKFLVPEGDQLSHFYLSRLFEDKPFSAVTVMRDCAGNRFFVQVAARYDLESRRLHYVSTVGGINPVRWPPQLKKQFPELLEALAAAGKELPPPAVDGC